MRPGSLAGIVSRAGRHQFHQQLEKEVRHSAWQDAKAENAWRGVKNGAVARLVANVSCGDNPSSIIPPFPAFHSGHDFLSGQELFQVSCDPSLFIVRFVMTRCTALEFRSQAVTFAGNRLLLVTTVQIGACVGWQDKDVTKTSPRKCHCKQEHEDELQMKLHIHPKVQVKHKVLQNYSRKAFVNFVPSTWHHRPSQCSPNLSGLVDPPCHAQEAPHLLEGNRCVPTADSMGTIQSQQVQAYRANEDIMEVKGFSQEKRISPSRGVNGEKSCLSRKERWEKNKPTGTESTKFWIVSKLPCRSWGGVSGESWVSNG